MSGRPRGSSARRLAGLVVAVPWLLAACLGASPTAVPGVSPVTSPATSPDGERIVLTVFGASSLRDALASVQLAYERARPWVTLVVATASPAALATQIEQGAPADVLLSADTIVPQRLADAGLASGAPIVFAGNALAIIVPAANDAGIRSPTDLARAGVSVIAAGDQVPITGYATRLVENLAGEPGYPADFAAAYRANITSREDSARAVVAKIALGEGDAGIAYATDAATPGVLRVDVPESANVRATYAGVVVAASRHIAEAQAFLAWLAGPAGQSILAGFGFLPP